MGKFIYSDKFVPSAEEKKRRPKQVAIFIGLLLVCLLLIFGGPHVQAAILIALLIFMLWLVSEWIAGIDRGRR